MCRNDNNNSLFTNSNDNSEFFIVQKPSVNLPLCAFVVLWFTRCRGFQRTEDIGHRESAIRHRLIECMVGELHPARGERRGNELECFRLGHNITLRTACAFVKLTSSLAPASSEYE